MFISEEGLAKFVTSISLRLCLAGFVLTASQPAFAQVSGTRSNQPPSYESKALVVSGKKQEIVEYNPFRLASDEKKKHPTQETAGQKTAARKTAGKTVANQSKQLNPADLRLDERVIGPQNAVPPLYSILESAPTSAKRGVNQHKKVPSWYPPAASKQRQSSANKVVRLARQQADVHELPTPRPQTAEGDSETGPFDFSAPAPPSSLDGPPTGVEELPIPQSRADKTHSQADTLKDELSDLLDDPGALEWQFKAPPESASSDSFSFEGSSPSDKPALPSTESPAPANTPSIVDSFQLAPSIRRELGITKELGVIPQQEQIRLRHDRNQDTAQQLTELRLPVPAPTGNRQPAWLAEIRFPMLRYAKQSELALVDAIHNAIQFAPEIQVLRADVSISEAEVIRQKAGFDWNQFLDANWDENNLPVGNQLDGAQNRLEQHTLATQTGIRKLNQLGGQFQLAQDLGIADSNSQFFIPPNQATANIALEYEQPLLQGAGRLVNSSVIEIAITDANISQEDFLEGLQTHVLDVVTAYWDLVARRADFAIAERSYDRALRVATIIANRVHLDVGPVQSARAEATLGSRRTALLQAEYDVVFAQEQLLRLVFGAKFKQSVDTEIIPVSDMIGPLREVAMDKEIQVGLKNRPEVARTIQLIKRSSIEQGVAKNQLLPALGLTLSLSNQGLRGNRGVAGAINDQFGFGDPTYGVGVSYALPLGNRAAKANYRQAQLRVKRLQSEFEQVVSEIALEVRNAAHNISLSGQQREATRNAYALAKRELDVLEKRSNLLIDGDKVGPLYLDNLLQTQERLAIAESAFIQAASNYALSQFELQRSTGALLRSNPLPVEAAASRTWAHRQAARTPESAQR